MIKTTQPGVETMAGRSGVCRTVGYVDPITGNQIIFERQEKPKAGKARVSKLNGDNKQAINRWINGSWNDLDDWFHSELKELLPSLQYNAEGEMFISGQRVA